MNIIRWLLKQWAVIVLLLGVAGFFYYRQQGSQMHERAKFTIGAVDGWHYTAKSGRFFNFHFVVEGQQYGGSSPRQAHMNEANGARYLVEYDSLAPSQNVGHFDVPIPDTIHQAPAVGWRRPPFPVPAWILDHGR